MTDTIPRHVQRIAATIAADPVKLAASRNAMYQFTKQAGVGIFGGIKPTGSQKVLGNIAGGAGVALLGVAGLSLANKYKKFTTGMTAETEEEAHKELGKMYARADFAAANAKGLSGAHASVFKDLVKSDELIKDADRTLMTTSFNTMTRFAPLLASDHSAARSFLRASAENNSGPSFATIQTLADAERAVQQVGGVGGGK